MSLKRRLDKVPRILEGTFFKITESVPNGSVKATCQVCSKVVSGFFRPTSNFINHLKTSHPESFREYEEKGTEKKLRMDGQTTLNFSRAEENPIVLSEDDRRLINFVAKTMQPISVVEDPSFRALLNGLNSDYQVPTVKTFKIRFDTLYQERIGILRNKLSAVKNVCLTADLWSSHKRSFMGVTAHWLTVSNGNFVKNSAMLSLTRFPGKHSYDRIAEMLQLVMTSFEIEDKVKYIVTDNGSNFVKAFEQFHAPDESVYITDGVNEDYGDSINDHDDHADDLRTEFPETNDCLFLPKHFRCADHSIHLIAKEEPSMKSPEGKDVGKRVMRSAMAKCSAIWNRANRSVQFAESISLSAGKSIMSPVCTRWNSTHDALKRLLELQKSFGEICQKAKVKPFTPKEIEFMEGYKLAMEPLAWAIKTLEGEKNSDSYFGYLAPTCVLTASKLSKIINAEDANVYARVIAAETKEKFCEKFKAVLEFDLKTAKYQILAAVLLPKFKMNWIPAMHHAKIQEVLVADCQKLCGQGMSQECETGQADTDSEWNEIMIESRTSSRPASSQAVEIEFLQYLNDSDTSLQSVIKYPIIMQMFLLYNSALPSSAPAERLFSYAGMILRPNRSRLSDEVFEKLCFLNLYKDF